MRGRRRRRRRARIFEFLDPGCTPHRFDPHALELDAQLLGHGGQKQRRRAQRGVDLRPVDILRRRQSAETESVDGAEMAVVGDAEAVVVDVGALEPLQLLGVVVVGCVECVSLVLEFRQGEGKGIAGAPEILFFGVEGEGFRFQRGDFGVQGCLFLFKGQEVGEGVGVGGPGFSEGFLGFGKVGGGWGGGVEGLEEADVGVSFFRCG